MAIETEIKLRVTDIASTRAKLDLHGYQSTGPRVFEINQVYDRSNGELRGSDMLLRLRSSDGRWTITYKGPRRPGAFKSREEIESEVSDGAALGLILIGLGYTPSFRYEKFRTEFTTPGEPGIVMLDETPIGNFLELEGPEYWIDQAATSLGFHPAEYITSSYAALYGEYRRSNDQNAVPADMRF